jgi:response regulator RpfG family c-di-GMP phosphodiesterase
MTDTENDTLRFAAEKDAKTPTDLGRNWKLLVVDDDDFVHRVTSMVLRGYRFEGVGLTILSARSAAEGRRLLEENPDTAVMLLDVVMENPQAGLDLAAWTRKELKNTLVRIILRTGQPGEAPEQEVIFKYDINDYKEKSELTSQKLYTTITTAIRSYRDMRALEFSRRGLARILTASSELFKSQSLGEFASGVLTQLASTVCQGDDTLMARASGVAASRRGDQFRVIASTGKFEQARGRAIAETGDHEAIRCIERAAEIKRSFFQNDAFVGYFRTATGSENIIYLQGTRPISETNRELIEIFSSNISVAFDNIDHNAVMHDTQRELLITLGEVVETRSPQTVNHVRRMAEYARLLATMAGMGQDRAETLRLASTMHDIGKIGVPDAVLLKPGSLDETELKLIRKHPEIGYDILKGADSLIMQIAATVALQHHERWDGQGYPAGLTGEGIDLAGRIVMLADVFDSLGCDRPHRRAWPMADILRFIKENRGTMFDPALVDMFMENKDEFLAIRERLTDGQPERQPERQSEGREK